VPISGESGDSKPDTVQNAIAERSRRAASACSGEGDSALEDLIAEFGLRWDIAGITGGYRAVLRETNGHTPVPRYGRTPAELAESIRTVEHQP
jgi:hypothetical protein